MEPWTACVSMTIACQDTHTQACMNAQALSPAVETGSLILVGLTTSKQWNSITLKLQRLAGMATGISSTGQWSPAGPGVSWKYMVCLLRYFLVVLKRKIRKKNNKGKSGRFSEQRPDLSWLIWDSRFPHNEESWSQNGVCSWTLTPWN